MVVKWLSELEIFFLLGGKTIMTVKFELSGGVSI
jgi:hypothetical protein